MVRWAVVGLGRAGSARARALSVLPGACLVGAWSRRFGEDPAEALHRTRPDILVVSLEDRSHAEWIARGLLVGCDVLVDYPLVPDRAGLDVVRDAAAAAGKGVRVSWLSRDSAQGRALVPWIETPRPASWEVRFDGGLPAWVLDELVRGNHAAAAAGRLRLLRDVLGPWGACRAEVRREGAVWRCTYRIEGSHGRASLVETRSEGRARHTEWWVDGAIVDPVAEPPGTGLFERDLLRWQEVWLCGAWGRGLPAEEEAFARELFSVDVVY